MPWIVDGYNYIFRDPHLGPKVEAQSIFAARTALLRQLGAFVGRRGRRITVVFDGAIAGAGRSDRQRHGAVEVIFAEPIGTADARIVEAIETRPPAADWHLVTSDRRLARSVRALGANVVSCEKFRVRLNELREACRSGIPDGEPDSKYGSPARWEIEYWTKEFGIE